MLGELGIEQNPIPTDDVITSYNDLRQDIVLLYELKLALANCEYELQTQKHRLETLAPDRVSSASRFPRVNIVVPTSKEFL